MNSKFKTARNEKRGTKELRGGEGDEAFRDWGCKGNVLAPLLWHKLLHGSVATRLGSSRGSANNRAVSKQNRQASMNSRVTCFSVRHAADLSKINFASDA